MPNAGIPRARDITSSGLCGSVVNRLRWRAALRLPCGCFWIWVAHRRFSRKAAWRDCAACHRWPNSVQLPARIGKYELEKFLGGGMSHVYRARDTVIGRTVALKILTEQGCADPEAKARFLQEARMAGNIQHENIIQIFGFGEEEGRPFMVMEFLVGQDLRDAIKAGATGDLPGKLRIALQVARALEYVH